MKILHLNLKKEWFDKIKSGEKKIEYREYKPYWISRLLGHRLSFSYKDFSEVHIKNGYKKNSEVLKFKLEIITLLENGLETDLKINKPVFAIYLGKRINA